MNSTIAKRNFLLWLRENHPALYAAALRRSGIGLGDFASTISNIFNSVSGAIQNLAPTYLQTKQQIELLKLNIKRAQQGLTPYATLDEASGATGATVPAAPAPASEGIPPWLLYGGLALLAYKFLR